MNSIPGVDSTPSPEDPYSRWTGWAGQPFGAYSRSEARTYAWLFRRLANREGPLRVLEVGFGNGNFLGWAKAQGHPCQGVELNPHLVQKAREAGFEACTDLGELPPETRFEVIVAFDVLEHIPLQDLPTFVTRLRDCLVPGGRMLFRFPNGDSPFGHPIQYGDLSHVTVLGSGRFGQLCDLCGLQILGWDEPPWHVVQPHRPLKGLLHGVLTWGLERLFRKLYYKRRVSLSPNLLVIVQVAP